MSTFTSSNTMDPQSTQTTKQSKLLHCINWMKQQNVKKYETTPKSSICLDDDATTIPDAVDDTERKPVQVPLLKLRTDKLHLKCDWNTCQWFTDNYEKFQKHVRKHVADVPAVKKHDADGGEYICLWDVCGHKTTDCHQIVRHINYHAYHTRLMAIGYNGRATLNLMSCKKDSSLRNQLPALESEHCCRWFGCEEKFDSIQALFNHMRHHTIYSDEPCICSWAGCGMKLVTVYRLHHHVRTHTGEKLIACFHCGAHFTNNRKLCDHLRRQNAHPALGHTCSMCARAFGTEYLLREHLRRHISVFACALCDMSAVSLSALAEHVRYRHLPDARVHACPHCDHKSITRGDLKSHILSHARKAKKARIKQQRDDSEEEDITMTASKKARNPKKVKKYICHICRKQVKIFSRGTRLTSHLVKHHGLQWPFGHSRFRYQISDDGYYRLTTTRYESLEVSKKIVDRSSVKKLLKTPFDIKISKKSGPTESSPLHYEINLKGIDGKVFDTESDTKPVEITMCDVDEDGNIISSEVISDVVYT